MTINDIRRKLTSLVTVSSVWGDLLLAVVRVFAGLAMAFAHGWGKMLPSDRFVEAVAEMGFPVPLLFAYAASFSEFFGGILLAAGCATRPSAGFVLITMLVAGLIRHGDQSFGQMEKALLYAALMLVFVVLGGGRYSVDALLRRTGPRH